MHNLKKKRKQIGYIALVIVTGILGWAWGDHKRTEEELNRVYYPILYSEVIRAIDPVSKQVVNFEIKWHEDFDPGLKGAEPTRILKYPDKSQAVTLVRRWERKEYSFDLRAPGFKDYTLTVKPADRYMNSEVADQTRDVVLEPVEVRRGNAPEEK